MERHDAGQGAEDARRERRALAKKPARGQEDEGDRGRPEEDLEDACGRERGPRRREEVRVERRDEERHRAFAAEQQVPLRDARGEACIDAAVDLARRLQERVVPELREDRRLQREGGEKEQEERPAHPTEVSAGRRASVPGGAPDGPQPGKMYFRAFAAASRSPRKSGCAMPMRAIVLCRMFLPHRSAAPYSVTT